MFLRQKTKGKVIISWNQFSSFIATLGYPGKGSVYYLKVKKALKFLLLLIIKRSLYLLAGEIFLQNYENMNSFQQTFRECFVLFVKLVVQL